MNKILICDFYTISIIQSLYYSTISIIVYDSNIYANINYEKNSFIIFLDNKIKKRMFNENVTNKKEN